LTKLQSKALQTGGKVQCSRHEARLTRWRCH